MPISRLKNTLEVTTSVAVLVAAVGFISALSWGFFVQRRAPSVSSGLQKGQTIASLPTIDYGSATQTLLVFMKTDCHFCAESIPFCNSLARSRVEGGKTTRIVAVFPNTNSEVKQYVQRNQLQLEAVAGVNPRAIAF